MFFFFFLLFTRWCGLYFVQRKLYIFSSFQFKFLFDRHNEFKKFFVQKILLFYFFYSDLIKIPSALLQDKESSREKKLQGSWVVCLHDTRIYREGDRKQNRRFLLHLILYILYYTLCSPTS